MRTQFFNSSRNTPKDLGKRKRGERVKKRGVKGRWKDGWVRKGSKVELFRRSEKQEETRNKFSSKGQYSGSLVS